MKIETTNDLEQFFNKIGVNTTIQDLFDNNQVAQLSLNSFCPDLGIIFLNFIYSKPKTYDEKKKCINVLESSFILDLKEDKKITFPKKAIQLSPNFKNQRYLNYFMRNLIGFIEKKEKAIIIDVHFNPEFLGLIDEDLIAVVLNISPKRYIPNTPILSRITKIN